MHKVSSNIIYCDCSRFLLEHLIWTELAHVLCSSCSALSPGLHWWVTRWCLLWAMEKWGDYPHVSGYISVEFWVLPGSLQGQSVWPCSNQAQQYASGHTLHGWMWCGMMRHGSASRWLPFSLKKRSMMNGTSPVPTLSTQQITIIGFILYHPLVKENFISKSFSD